MERTIHLAVIRGMTENEVQSLYRQKKDDLAEGVIFYWSYMATDDPKRLSNVINDGADAGDIHVLDDILRGVGEGPLFRSQILGIDT